MGGRRCHNGKVAISTVRGHLYVQFWILGKDYVLVPSSKKNSNKKLLVYKKFMFSQYSSRIWYCSKRAKGCKAAVYMDKDDKVDHCNEMHTHPPPMFHVTKTGQYVRI
ncbi:hypothetical protein EVAR_42949_1 [Eumeta japonica]|uniref:S1-like domain-containing protein n=1 Tax=Eumeta variegata TaxID=151549 RepID=A0A4C1YH66_EUMVA|nr:hypothetical protein EVAR_42949_1 [Eumeta japonica]